MEDHAECILVLIGATPEGKKELISFQVGGMRERTKLARIADRSAQARLADRALACCRRQRSRLLAGAR